MPSIEENLRAWNREYNWAQEGDEWSAVWGGAEAQWSWAILPRIHRFIPAATILELAPGFGRWTQFLRRYCERLILVDLSEKAIDACKRRFSAYSGIEYFVNDGRSLGMIGDGVADFVFSFDSLVHVESEVIDAYLRQLSRILKRNGVGFLHHSNIGTYKNGDKTGLVDGVVNRHWRAESMTAADFLGMCQRYGLDCIAQEIVNWGQAELNDCFSVFTPSGSIWSRETRILSNPRFMDEAFYIQELSRLYANWRYIIGRPESDRR